MVLLSAVGCGGGQGAATKKSPDAKGGTLTVLAISDFAHLDPARNWTMPDMMFGTRLLYRTLTTYKAGSSEIVPDLATDLGVSEDGGKTWKFTLKDGLTYEDGTPIKAADIKHNVERSMAADINGGPDYAQKLLVGGTDYKGPYEGKHLESVETPDDRTIIFRLKRPAGEFPYTVTLPTFSPVPESKDTKVGYDNRPFSSGPYKIEKYERGKELVLVRNEHWAKQTDPVRLALPDRIDVKQGQDKDTITDRLIASAGEDATSVPWGSAGPQSLSKILPNPQAKNRLVGMVTGCTDTLVFNTTKKPFDNPKVRQAIYYAIDKESVQTAAGGPNMSEIATSYLPPTMTGGVKQDVYQAPPTGDVVKAKALLAEAGVSTPLKVKMTASSGSSNPLEVSIQESLKKIGVDVEINTVDNSVYYDTIGDQGKADELATYGWCPDYPNGSSFLPPMFDSRGIKPTGNSGNVAYFKDPAIDKKIDETYAITDPSASNKAWQALDAQVMRELPQAPLQWGKRAYLIGKNVVGAVNHPVWAAQLDYAVLGVKPS
ncbi:ABC transporter substrate-binding protein [Nonomuraea sediminis]|uniref:ABC transporter substrate-binding protein n=1 Tax=Nonomuraea sediminis TaxID=2835864 RepID=UPI0027E1C9B1|nr:ABC transporter substrate-binding protein [Nonomuraea sediminis]